MKKNLLNVGLIFIICIISLVTVVFWGTNKKGFHEDEYYSYYSSNYSEGWGVTDGSWVYSDRYADEFVVLEGEEFNYGWIKTVQSWDVHPPMYYWILHTVCSIWKNIFSKWQGLLVNIVFYLYSLVFFYLICLECKDNKWMAAVMTLCYSLSCGAISGVMFIRMYTLVSALILSSVYLHLRALKKDKLCSVKYLLLICLNVYAGALTHYYFLVYQFFMSACVCIYYLIKTKKLKQSLVYGCSILASLGLAVLTFPSIINQMFSGYRGAEATANFFDISNTLSRIQLYGGLSFKAIFYNAIVAIIFISCLILGIIKAKKKRKPFDVFLLIIIFGYFFVIAKTGLLLAEDSLRYILPIFSLVYIFVYICLNDLMQIKKGIWLVAFLLLVLLGADVFNQANGNILFLYQEDEAKIEFAKNHSDIPVLYIYPEDNSWRFLETADEFMEYEILGFYSDSSTENFEDEYLASCESLICYIGNESEEVLNSQIDRLQNTNSNLEEYDLIYSGKYFDLYYFY